MFIFGQNKNSYIQLKIFIVVSINNVYWKMFVAGLKNLKQKWTEAQVDKLIKVEILKPTKQNWTNNMLEERWLRN